MSETVKISVKLSKKANDRLEQLAEHLANGNKSELMRKMISVIDIYDREQAKDPDLELALVKEGKVDSRIIL